MKKLILLLSILSSAFITQAQINGSVKGKLIDTSGKQPLSEATVSVMLVKDSSLISFSLSDKKGNFEITNLDVGNYLLMISYTGYENFKKQFTVTAEKKTADLGEIILQKEYKTLAGVTVTDLTPVKVNGDTVSFKADAFKTKPNATTEDLLKKLPGVQVEKDGTVKAMGENVQKVLVDGKEFFGNDPKLATKNITADMVDQIQVFDDMSEQSKFTKIDDGSRSKTINIKLKKDKNKGDFGKIAAGGGSDGRYEGNLSFNHFRGNQRISLLAAANNTNKQGFSFSDIISSQGGMAQFSKAALDMGALKGAIAGGGGFGGGFGGGSNGSGITTSRSIGLNYNDQWSKKIDFRSSYFFSQSDNLLKQSSFRQTYFPDDSSTDVTTESESRNRNRSHRFNVRWEYAIDSMNSVLYTANLNFQESNGKYMDTSYTFSHGVYDYLAVSNKTANKNTRDGMNYSGELLYRKKFRRIGRTFTLGWRNGYNESDAENYSLAPYNFYKPDGSLYTSPDQNLKGTQDTKANNNTVSSSYTEPLGKNKILELNYAYTHNRNISDKESYDYNSISGKYDVLNLLQTNYFENTNISNRLGFNYRLQQKTYNYQLGLAIQFTELGSRSIRANTGKDTTITQNFTNFFPTASFTYSVNKTKNFRFNYRGRTNAPSITQLQDVADVTNPIQVKTGNPSLKQEFISNFNINYSTFNIMSFRFFTTNFSVSTTGNKIVNSIDSINRAVTISRPVNLDGAYNVSAFGSFGFPIKKLKGSNVNLTTIVNYNHDISMIYKEKNLTNRLLLTQTFGFNYNKNKFDMGVTGGLTYNNARYSLQENLNTHYFTQTYTADFSYTFKKDIIFSTDFDLLINSGRSDGFNQSIPMWNASLSKQFLKNKAAELRFTVYDILNQNKSITRTIGENYYEDNSSNVLRRYFLISFIYNLKRMAGKQVQMPQNMQRMMDRGMKQFRN
ncbi:MAG TPA: outer membrane beta-barrel family protein [Chitinophagaceae bacterium]|nr:outer membrane beta-barrel family protein [Chitinophagaceae bacterium]